MHFGIHLCERAKSSEVLCLSKKNKGVDATANTTRSHVAVVFLKLRRFTLQCANCQRQVCVAYGFN